VHIRRGDPHDNQKNRRVVVAISNGNCQNTDYKGSHRKNTDKMNGALSLIRVFSVYP